MAFKDKEDFLDKLFDHWWNSDDEPTDEDQEDFDKFAEFFNFLDENSSSGGSSNAPRRRRRSSTTSKRRRSSSSSSEGSYGSKAWFGGN